MNNNTENFGQIFFEKLSFLLEQNKTMIELFEQYTNKFRDLYLDISNMSQISDSSLSSEKNLEFQENYQSLQERTEENKKILDALKEIYREQERISERNELKVEVLEAFNQKMQEGLNSTNKLQRINSFFTNYLEEYNKKVPDKEMTAICFQK
ncbi:hypothetical protein [Rickettsiella massiliensis]|uniref:hypothetical protein n=1 Tax=Rickettsiella massiliensis TaxID=676517 RepID=UPI00029AC344|nr:hypothetical protein [Rickettsiella massiliensis]